MPSWEDTTTKQTIIDFVQDVSNPSSLNYIPPSDRIVTFDNDGTLWTEKPAYIQELFILDRLGFQRSDVKKLVPKLASLSENNVNLGESLLTGMTPEEYKQKARDFLDNSLHPYLKVPYIELTYQPMVELVSYLRNNDFNVYICSGGGLDFIRSFAEDAYGIPPESVIGTSIQTEYIAQADGSYLLLRKPILVQPINDGPGKPVGIERYIGKKPIMAVGNSTGDLEMLDYTDDHQGRALMMLLRHDDPRECPYAEEAQIECPYDQKPDDTINAFDVANSRGWTVISMKDDFVTVFGNLNKVKKVSRTKKASGSKNRSGYITKSRPQEAIDSSFLSRYRTYYNR
ncbi:MAG: haloacid dehalogenase-like hydrolase [Symploca sp. SIO2E9]|nr:haloacid dehalogenase-like hydrolase [Symploca sp. SIO2E9]